MGDTSRIVGESAKAALAKGNFKEVEPPLESFNDNKALEKAFLDVFNCSYQRLIGSLRLTGVQHKAYTDSMIAALDAAKKLGVVANRGTIIQTHHASMQGKLPFRSTVSRETVQDAEVAA